MKSWIGLCRAGLFLALLLFLYGTLFPFHFEVSSSSWSAFDRAPFWDMERGRIHSLPDMLANVLLTIPLGFFGFLVFDQWPRTLRIVILSVVGFFIGLTVEILQLGIPSRSSGITDAFTNGIGALVGAGLALHFGRKLIHFVSEGLSGRIIVQYWILVSIIAAAMLLPLDLGLSVSHVIFGVKALLTNPWESGMVIQDEWVVMAEFALLGALSGSLRKSRIATLTLAFPFLFEMMRLLIESHAPSVRDLALNLAGVVIGMTAVRMCPTIVRPESGLILMSLALAAQGLSPYRIGSRGHFEWIPLVEYYHQTTGGAWYDGISGLLNYGLLTSLRPARKTILWAVALASGIEVAQIYLASRFAGTTDILIAGIGAWAGYSIARVNRLGADAQESESS